MNLSDQLLEFFQRLRAEGAEETLFRDEEVQGMLAGHSEYHELREQLADAVQGKEEIFILLALRALAKQRAELQPQLVKTDLVVTFPGPAKIPARHTSQVVREMIVRARSEIIVGGYAITKKGGLPELLAAASGSVQRIVVLCSPWKSDAGASGPQAILKSWPANKVKPWLYQFKGDAEASLMHVKTIIVDAEDLLVTSANFTESGMKNNVEFGVRIGGKTARDAQAVIEEFIRSGRFERVA